MMKWYKYPETKPPYHSRLVIKTDTNFYFVAQYTFDYNESNYLDEWILELNDAPAVDCLFDFSRITHFCVITPPEFTEENADRF